MVGSEVIVAGGSTHVLLHFRLATRLYHYLSQCGRQLCKYEPNAVHRVSRPFPCCLFLNKYVIDSSVFSFLSLLRSVVSQQA